MCLFYKIQLLQTFDWSEYNFFYNLVRTEANRVLSSYPKTLFKKKNDVSLTPAVLCITLNKCSHADVNYE